MAWFERPIAPYDQDPAPIRSIGEIPAETLAEILRRENGYLDTLAAEYLPPSGTAVETARLLSAPEALRSRWWV